MIDRAAVALSGNTIRIHNRLNVTALWLFLLPGGQFP